MYGTFACIMANGSVPDVKDWEGCTEQEFRTVFHEATEAINQSMEVFESQDAV